MADPYSRGWTSVAVVGEGGFLMQVLEAFGTFFRDAGEALFEKAEWLVANRWRHACLFPS